MECVKSKNELDKNLQYSGCFTCTSGGQAGTTNSEKEFNYCSFLSPLGFETTSILDMKDLLSLSVIINLVFHKNAH